MRHKPTRPFKQYLTHFILNYIILFAMFELNRGYFKVTDFQDLTKNSKDNTKKPNTLKHALEAIRKTIYKIIIDRISLFLISYSRVLIVLHFCKLHRCNDTLFDDERYVKVCT